MDHQCKMSNVTGDYDGRISIMQFFNYVMRKVWLQQTRIGYLYHRYESYYMTQNLCVINHELSRTFIIRCGWPWLSQASLEIIIDYDA